MTEQQLTRDHPAPASIEHVSAAPATPGTDRAFVIAPGKGVCARLALVSPD